MKKLLLGLAVTVAVAGCSRGQAIDVAAGSDVTLQKKDGVTVTGRVIEVKPDQVVVETRNGEQTRVQRSDISSLRADVRLPDKNDAPAPRAEAPPARPEPPAAPSPDAVGSTGTSVAKADESKPSSAAATAPDAKPAYREVTIPAGTVLPLELRSAVGSDTSNVEDTVRAAVRRAVVVNGVTVLPVGTPVVGHVTAAEQSARVKGRARIAFRFTRLDPPGDAERVAIQTGVVSRVAPATKKQDAAKIGGGAAGGAIIGGILGGGDGAAKGAAIGGAAGTGVVLSTRGKEVRLGAGAPVTVTLRAPVTVRVPIRNQR